MPPHHHPKTCLYTNYDYSATKWTMTANITAELKSQIPYIVSLPYIVRVHPKRNDIISESIFCDCNIVTKSNISSDCHNHCFIKPRDVVDDTEDNNRNKDLEHLYIGILLSVLVGVANSCEPDEEEIIINIKNI